MTQLSYFRADPDSPPPQPAGLIVWGIGSLVTGGGFAVLCFVATTQLAIASSGRTAPSSFLYSYTLFSSYVAVALWAILLIWLGVGALRSRRWVRPVALAAALSNIAFNLGGVMSMLQYAVIRSNFPTYSYVLPRISAMALATAAFIYFCRPSIREILNRRDPILCWTDTVATPLFVWSATAAMYGALATVQSTLSVILLRNTSNGYPILWVATAILLIGGLLSMFGIRVGTWSVIAALLTLAILDAVWLGYGTRSNVIASTTRSVAAARRLPPAALRISAGLVTSTLIYLAAIVYGLYAVRYQNVITPKRFAKAPAPSDSDLPPRHAAVQSGKEPHV